ncbi:MAG: hypothetical protein ACTSRI_18455 [Promethearchaeota archaeon]
MMFQDSKMDYECLECEKEYKNELNIAICPKCLEKERENYKKGIKSKYITVNLFLEKEKNSHELRLFF